MTSTGPLAGTSFNPSCSSSAAKIEGPGAPAAYRKTVGRELEETMAGIVGLDGDGIVAELGGRRVPRRRRLLCRCTCTGHRKIDDEQEIVAYSHQA